MINVILPATQHRLHNTHNYKIDTFTYLTTKLRKKF